MEKQKLRPLGGEIHPSLHSFKSANIEMYFRGFPSVTSTSTKSASIIGAIGHVDDAEQPKLPSSTQSYAPNGGYGWIVVLASFVSHFVFGGVERSEGIYFLEFKRRFGRSSAISSLPGAFVTALRLFVGPIAGALSFRYSVRLTCLIGSLLLFLGMLLNAFVTDFDLLYFSHSALQGAGRGFLYTPSLIIVADYFDKRRGIANGLSTSGGGIGTSLLAPLQQFLFNYYGYSGAFMVIAAITLHTAIAAMLYKPLIVTGSSKDGSDQKGVVYSSDNTATSSSVTALMLDGSDTMGVIYTPENTTNSNSAIDLDNNEKPVCSSNHSGSTVDIGETARAHVAVGVRISDDVTIVTFHSIDNSEDSIKSKDKVTTQVVSISTIESDSIKKIGNPRRSLMSFFSIQTEIMREHQEKLNNHFSLNLLSNPPFVLFCFSITLFTAASKSIFTFIPALIISKGYSPSEAAYVLSVTGAVDILGRISAGLVFDMLQDRLVRPVIVNVIIGLLAIVTFILPLISGYVAICLVCGINSILTGAYVSQKTVISMDVLGPSNIPNSIGIFIFFQGFGVLVGVPLSGALGELEESFSMAFFVNGALLVMSGIVMSLSNVLIRNQERANESV